MDELIEANRELFEEAGLIEEDGQFDLGHFVQAVVESPPARSALPTAIRDEVQQLIDQTREVAKNLANAGHRSEGVEISRKMNEALGKFDESLQEKLPDYWHAKRAEEEGAAGDPRPREYVMQPGEKEVPRKLSNTYRDWGHIGRFVANRAQIDFLQVDRAQFNRMTDVNRTGPSQLSEYGLENRVFTASLENVADELTRRKKGRGLITIFIQSRH